jgi:hypothetical protein
MKIDGLGWMDWLHKTRQKMEDERTRSGQSEVEWLKEAGARARAIKQEPAGREASVVRDRKAALSRPLPRTA